MRTTQRLILIPVSLAALLSVSTSASEGRVREKVPTGRIAEHAVCRALFAVDGTAQVVCYLAFADGISGSLFSGTPSEATAFFTVRSDVISAQPISNGNIIVFLQSPGTYDVYFNNSPHGDWNNPDSFSTGELVASFKRTPPILINVGTMGNGFFSATLTNSREFVFNGRVVDFKRVVPTGLTWLLTAAAAPIPGPPGFVAAQAFAGAALATGDNMPKVCASTNSVTFAR